MFPHIQIQGILLGRFFLAQWWRASFRRENKRVKVGFEKINVLQMSLQKLVPVTACWLKKKLVGVVGCKHVIMYVYLCISIYI